MYCRLEVVDLFVMSVGGLKRPLLFSATSLLVKSGRLYLSANSLHHSHKVS
ncbi:MAG: hypothetical protein J6A44_02710 [Paludibacteraceae bacterium]|nr:hypothetical protein [Paludibacteraceae bacterium]